MIDSDEKLKVFASLLITEALEKGKAKGYDSLPWTGEEVDQYAKDCNMCMDQVLYNKAYGNLLDEDYISVAAYAIMLAAREYNKQRKEEIDNDSALYSN